MLRRVDKPQPQVQDKPQLAPSLTQRRPRLGDGWVAHRGGRPQAAKTWTAATSPQGAGQPVQWVCLILSQLATEFPMFPIQWKGEGARFRVRVRALPFGTRFLPVVRRVLKGLRVGSPRVKPKHRVCRGFCWSLVQRKPTIPQRVPRCA